MSTDIVLTVVLVLGVVALVVTFFAGVDSDPWED